MSKKTKIGMGLGVLAAAAGAGTYKYKNNKRIDLKTKSDFQALTKNRLIDHKINSRPPVKTKVVQSKYNINKYIPRPGKKYLKSVKNLQRLQQSIPVENKMLSTLKIKKRTYTPKPKQKVRQKPTYIRKTAKKQQAINKLKLPKFLLKKSAENSKILG